MIKITSGKDLILEICVSDFTLVIAELLASMALYPINEFAAKETCRGAEIESDAVVYRAIVDPEKEFDFVRNFVQSLKNVFSSYPPSLLCRIDDDGVSSSAEADLLFVAQVLVVSSCAITK